LKLALAIACGLTTSALLERESWAFEKQWHVGLEGGYALASFPKAVLKDVELPAATVSGFDVGLHGTYGLTDAFNLRLHADVSAFDLPEPRSSALLVTSGLGAEYVFDVLRWVPYVGVTAGPSVMHVQNDRTVVHLGVEVPLGLGYQITRNWVVGAEVRYRLLLLGDEERSPMNGFLGLARAEFAWGS
jgi:opacity protein-like surface antigen